MDESYVATFDSKTGRGTMIPKQTFWTRGFTPPRSTIPSIPSESPDDVKRTETHDRRQRLKEQLKEMKELLNEFENRTGSQIMDIWDKALALQREIQAHGL